MPPFITSGVPPELQLVIFARIVAVLKFCKHNHPKQFNNIMELVGSISPIDLEESYFVMKTYFVEYPLYTLFIIYLYMIFVFGYIVFVLGNDLILMILLLVFDNSCLTVY